MLGTRVASAAVLIPAVLLLLWIGPETTAFAAAAGAVIGTYEFYTIAARSPFRFRLFPLPGYLAAPAFCLAGYWRNPWLMLAIIGVLALASLPALWTGPSPKMATGPDGPYPATAPDNPVLNWALSVFGPVYVGVPLALVVLIRASGPTNSEAVWWVVLICLGTWGADTGGYFFGRFFGRHKLAPKISPKKTVEGAVGGILTAMVGVALVGGLALGIPLYWTLPLGFVLAVASILGDLFESWIKRRFDTKDSGKLIPGHGGLLDRIDGFLAVTVVAYLFILVYR